MGIPHKAFYCKNIIFTLSIFLVSFLVLLAPVKGFAYDSSLFVVKSIKIDVTADDAVMAQEKAFSQAQKQAFVVIARRMVSDNDVTSMKIPDLDTIAYMIKDYEVNNEQISAVRYVGNFTFHFDQQAVGKYFSISGEQYTDKKSKPLLVLPVLQKGNKNTIWGQDNLWMQSWAKIEFPTALVPVEVPIGDLEDVADINDDNALRYERKSLDRMLFRYNAKEAAIMIAVPDATLGKQASLEEAAQGNLRISIYRTDRGRAEYVSDLLVQPTDQEKVGGLYERGVMKAYQSLQKNWKRRTAESVARSQVYYVRMPISSLKELNNKKNILSAVQGLSNMVSVSLKPVEAKMLLTYRGDETHLREALAGVHFSLGRAYRKDYDSSISNPQIAKLPVMYDLYFKQKAPVRRADNFYNPPAHAQDAGNRIIERQHVNDPNVHTF